MPSKRRFFMLLVPISWALAIWHIGRNWSNWSCTHRRDTRNDIPSYIWRILEGQVPCINSLDGGADNIYKNPPPNVISSIFCYSSTCLMRPPSWAATCLVRPRYQCPDRHSSTLKYLWSAATCNERTLLPGPEAVRSWQVLLYLFPLWGSTHQLAGQQWKHVRKESYLFFMCFFLFIISFVSFSIVILFFALPFLFLLLFLFSFRTVPIRIHILFLFFPFSFPFRLLILFISIS